MNNKTPSSKKLTDAEIEAYIQTLDLKDIRTWKKADQAAYIKARLKARTKQPDAESYSHWDLF